MPVTTKLGRMVTYKEGNSTHNDTWPSDHVVTWDLETNRNSSSSAKSMTTKYSRMVTYGENNSPMESHDSLIKLSCVFP